jgi:Bacterial Ig-like domain (group 3)/Calx-beta domain/MBG domain
MSIRPGVFAILLLLLVASARAQSGPQTTQAVVAGGGGASASGSLQVEGTAGQSVTGASAGGSFHLESGFWPAATALTDPALVVANVTATYGGTATLTATLKANGVGLPNQLITFTLNGTSVGTATTDSQGHATLSNVPLSGTDAGTYPGAVAAQFSGDLSFAAATASGQLTLEKATPLLQVSGGTFTYDGQAHQAAVSATGVNNEALLPLTVLYNGASSLPVNAGTYQVTATFAGNQNYGAVTHNQQSIRINQATQTLSFEALSNKKFGDADFTVSATASSGLSVNFDASGNCSVTGNTVHLTGAGTCAISASQIGDGNYDAASSVSHSFQIAQATSSTGVISSVSPSALNQSVSFTATVTSTAGIPSGTVQFKDNGTNLGGPLTLNASGMATLATADLTTGTHAITADYSGDANFVTSTGTLQGGQVVTPQPTLSPSLQFSSDSYSVNEAAGRATITVTRAGDLPEASVQFATSDLAALANCDVVTGNASARCDYTAVRGTLSFQAEESSKTFTVPLVNDVYMEGPETLTLTLSNAVGGTLGIQSIATLTINDNDAPGGPSNPIDQREFFVRQFYLDILNREPEPGGAADWLDRLNTCPRPGETLQNCDEIEVASAFFRSPEFFDRSFFIYKFYEAALGRQPQYDEYQSDLRRMTGFLAPEELEQRKREFADEFVNRPEFHALYDGFGSGQPFVDAVLTVAGTASPGTPAAAVTTFNRESVIDRLAASQITRAQGLRALMEAPEISQRFFNKGFVVVGYFAFLRRNPDAAYLNWIRMLNTTGDYREMIRGFMQSPEYRLRFGPNVGAVNNP